MLIVLLSPSLSLSLSPSLSSLSPPPPPPPPHTHTHTHTHTHSKHLFLNHPDYSVGRLTQERQQLVKNKHLITVAERLGLAHFMLRHPKALFSGGSIPHTLSNCLEAVLGAVFLDGGLGEADALFARLAHAEKVAV